MLYQLINLFAIWGFVGALILTWLVWSDSIDWIADKSVYFFYITLLSCGFFGWLLLFATTCPDEYESDDL